MAFSQSIYRECSQYPYVGRVSIEQDRVDFIYQFVKNRFIPEYYYTGDHYADDAYIDPSILNTAGNITGIPIKFLNSPKIYLKGDANKDISLRPYKYKSLLRSKICYYKRRFDKELNYIDIEFHEAVYPIRVSLYQIFNPGNVFKIWAQDYTDNQWFLLWDGSIQFEPYSTSRLFSPPLNACYFKTKMLKLQFRTSYEMDLSILDAVMLIGTSELILPKNSEKSITEILKEINCVHQFYQETDNLTEIFKTAQLDISVLQENFSEYCKSNVGKDFHESFKHEKVSRKEITCVVPFPKQSVLQGSTQNLFYKKCANIEKCSKYIDLSSDKSEELPHCNLSVLPDEIILKIFKELDLTSLCRMNCVNKRFNNLTEDPRLYTNLNMRYVRSESFANRVFSYFTPRCKYLKQLDLTLSVFDIKDFVEFFDKCGSSLTHLRLEYSSINNFAIKKISEICKNLKELDLMYCNFISKEGFSYLENLNNLEILNLGFTHISIPVLCKILQRNPQMLELHLQGVTAAFEVIKELRNSCQKLDTINLSRTSLTLDGIRALADCKNLRIIDFEGLEIPPGFCDPVNTSDWCKFFSSCQHLEEMHLSRPVIDDSDIFLTPCKNWKRLYFSCDFMTPDKYSTIFEECPKLQEIYFINCNRISNRLINEWKEKYPYVTIYVVSNLFVDIFDENIF